jgi:hypothetical protein
MNAEQFLQEVCRQKDEAYRYCYFCFGPTLADSIFSKSVIETYKEQVELKQVKNVIFKKITYQVKDVKKAFLLLRLIGDFSWQQAAQITGQHFSREDLADTRKALLKEVADTLN